eukprot:gnl/TRDRNA2_/TRDRNA2_171953_c1_seq1.p1 gnl/TRDRNA2_/TRDRNA2_171953_c1~~gnl/TRDRNA2_/TRDRNA2_171953_c1_seq1.p1  ORF type:complete len:184 (+),score=19.23 gnl/TRDRNA2_/TRDRNA2_171953_c1_seq1:73-624(+)
MRRGPRGSSMGAMSGMRGMRGGAATWGGSSGGCGVGGMCGDAGKWHTSNMTYGSRGGPMGRSMGGSMGGSMGRSGASMDNEMMKFEPVRGLPMERLALENESRPGTARSMLSDRAGMMGSTRMSVTDTLTQAISKGAPMYNAGGHKECFNLYANTAQQLMGRQMCASDRMHIEKGMQQARMVS